MDVEGTKYYERSMNLTSHRALGRTLKMSPLVSACLHSATTFSVCECMLLLTAGNSIPKLEGGPEKFSFEELSESTGGFSDAFVLGKGGFGIVYKGTLTSGRQVAIKRMNRDATQSQGMKEFKSEVAIISRVIHRNLIELRGYCDDPGRREYMLVYDLMPNGSLDDVLFKKTAASTSLSWPQKVKILEGTADGLDYLHRSLARQVIHRDIKCSNILLDKEWTAKVGDFGIARLVDHQGRPPQTQMAGTLGYIAPEVISEQEFSDKADVYAFGVVSLEIACGRRVLAGGEKGMGLVQWVRRSPEVGCLLRAVETRDGESDAKQMEMVLKVGVLCTHSNPRDRPSMRVVAQLLAGVVEVPAILFRREAFLKACLPQFFKREERLDSLIVVKREEELEQVQQRMRNGAGERANETQRMERSGSERSEARGLERRVAERARQISRLENTLKYSPIGAREKAKAESELEEMRKEEKRLNLLINKIKILPSELPSVNK